jgi:Cys-rich repeat protein
VGGAWSSYRSYIVKYLRQMAVITPYARFRLRVGTLGERNTLALEYARRSDEMPPTPSYIKPHPASVHAELLQTLLRETKEKTLVKFLAKDFSCIDAKLAARLVDELRLERETDASALEHKQVVQLAHLMRDAKFAAVPVDCLSPVDCAPGQTCQAGSCVTATGPCTSNTQCPGQVCNTASGRCVACVSPSDCPMGQTCRDNACVPTACVPGAVSCANATSVRRCSLDGMSESVTACPGAPRRAHGKATGRAFAWPRGAPGGWGRRAGVGARKWCT